MEIATFENRYPELDELLASNGHPGVHYALAMNQHIAEYLEKQWRPVNNMLPFKVRGPAGEALCILVQEGDPIQGATAAACVRRYDIDTRVDEATGLAV